MNEPAKADAEAQEDHDNPIEPTDGRSGPRRALRAIVALIGVVVAGRWIRRIVRGGRDN